MKSTTLPLLLLLVLLNSCKKEEDPIPECIQSAITTFSSNSCEHGASVQQYTFQGKSVYTFDMGFCGGDLPTFVKDANCNDLGFLGGLGGNTQINGQAFSTATYVRTIWSRP